MRDNPNQQDEFERDDWRAAYSRLNKVGRFQHDCLLRALSEALQRGNLRLRDVDGILDMGCGHGSWLNTLADIRGKANGLVGLDVSEKRLVVARSINPGIHFIQGDIRELPFGDSSFDMVTTFASLMFFPEQSDLNAAIGEIARVLRPDGCGFCFEPVIQGNTPGTRGVSPNLLSNLATANGLKLESSIPFFRVVLGLSTASAIRRFPELVCKMVEAISFLPGASRLYVLKAGSKQPDA